MAKLIQDIKGEINSAYIEAPFDEGLEILEKENYRIISLEENAKLRMQEGKDSFISKNGNQVKEDIIYIPKKGKYLTKISHISKNAKKAANYYQNDSDFYLNDKQIEESLSDSVALSVDSIPVNHLEDYEIINYIFGEYAKKYGEFLREAGINKLNIYTSNLQDKPFAN